MLADINGQLLPVPINLDTVNKLYGLALTSDELEAFFRLGLKRSILSEPRRMWLSPALVAIFMRNSFAAIRASSGVLIRRNSTKL